MSNDAADSIPGEKPPVAHVERPWGGFMQYVRNAQATVSLMTVLPGHRLSLQSHSGRAELWIVLDAGAIVQIGEATRECGSGDEIWISAHERHRLSCVGEKPVRVLEIAFGNWQQTDIKRFDDDYIRSEP